MRIVVIIPALNEQDAIGEVLRHIPASLRAEVIVVDNGSTDQTAQVATKHGARVIREPRRGYGSACLAGLAAAGSPDLVVFLDGDASDVPEEMVSLVEPIIQDRADLVIGSRMSGQRKPGAMAPHAVFGNKLFAVLLRLLYRQQATDLGPFRALRASALRRLQMKDCGFGWTAEMQAKAARMKLRVVEVPVSYRRRIGKSKISGSLWPSLQAGWVITTTLLKIRFQPLPR